MYQAFIVEVKELRKHNNADKLKVATIFGNNVIVGLDVKLSDIMCYFPDDGRLNTEYCRVNNLLRKKDENGKDIGGYLDEGKCKVGTLKLRGERSEGLLMPLSSLSTFTDISTLKVGDTITTLNGVVICEKYVVKNIRQHSQNNVKEGKKKKVDIDSYPFFQQHLDTSQYSYNKHIFKKGDLCYITLKCHGTSGRCSLSIKETQRLIPSFLYPIFKKFNILPKPKRVWELVSGTRRTVLKGNTDGYYKDTFRNKWHDIFKGKLHKGETIYYEIVGYKDSGNLIMPSCDNKKTKDKDFIKQYGDTTNFTYGCEKGQSDIYVYRMTMTNEDGVVIEYPWDLVKLRCEQMGIKPVLEFDKFMFTTIEDLDERINKYVDGADPIGKSHIREGVVIRIENKERFSVFKHKSFNFKVLENIIKLDDVEDLEDLV